MTVLLQELCRAVCPPLTENRYLPALAHRKGFPLAGIENAP